MRSFLYNFMCVCVCLFVCLYDANNSLTSSPHEKDQNRSKLCFKWKTFLFPRSIISIQIYLSISYNIIPFHLMLLVNREMISKWGVFVVFVAVRWPTPNLNLDMTFLVFVVIGFTLVNHKYGCHCQSKQEAEQYDLYDERIIQVSLLSLSIQLLW